APQHTRRILQVNSQNNSPVGIPSTHVENTKVINQTPSYLQDHLHTRGEYHKLFTIETFRFGITSTHVENTGSIIVVVHHRKDHLHTRGEYLSKMTLLRFVLGSPPHTWRIPEQICYRSAIIAITSTHVENTTD